jgi:aspartyl-tRNA(Asn)/glutamyl-tRNA(Gln) amidotransferase subunit C
VLLELCAPAPSLQRQGTERQALAKADWRLSAIFVTMEVNDALVENLANLARLQFNEQEKEIIKKDLQRMIHFVDKLNELNTEGVEPLLHMTEAINVLREDVVKGSITREEGLKNAPDTDGVFFKVPKVIKKQD